MKKREEIYHLHIDDPTDAARAHAAHVSHEVKHAPAPTISETPTPKNRKPHSKTRAFIMDKLEFVAVSVIVFLVIFVVMNWQALLINAQHYWDVWRGFQSPLEQLVEQKAPTPEKLPTASPIPSSNLIPPLSLEVYPPDMRLIIPRINQNVPVVGVRNENLIARKWNDLEADIQNSLRDGVIHYPGTALPGDGGNVVITGHSSYYAWEPGSFKDVFALLHDVKMGDRVVLYFNQKKFVYEVFNIKVVLPKDVDVLGPTPGEQLTLITCTPIGTNLKRLIVEARLVEKN